MIIIATNNQHKVDEFKKILPNYNIVSLKEMNIDIDIEENGKTFMDNAKIKARAIKEITKYPVVSDDSGIIIDALPDMLGIYSARFMEGYSNFEKNKKILELMKDVPFEKRTARFVSAVCYIDNNNVEYECLGIVEGKISDVVSKEEGFGYDPIFIPDGYNQTFAEIPDIKNKISHRAKSLEKLKILLEGNYENK